MLVELGPSKGCEGECIFRSSLVASGSLVSVFGIPWLLDDSPQCLPLCSQGGVLLCMSVSTCFLVAGTTVILD